MFNILLFSKSSDITDINTQIRLPYLEEENTLSKSYPEHFDKEDWTSKPMLNRDMSLLIVSCSADQIKSLLYSLFPRLHKDKPWM